MANTDFLETLRERLAEAETRLSKLETQSVEINRDIGNLRAAIGAYRVILEHEGGGMPGQKPTATLWGGRPPGPGDTPPLAVKGGRVPGNRSANMPPRTPRFAEMAIQKAILALATESKVPRHADDFARTIWVLRRPEELRRVKRSLNSEFVRLCRDGKLLRVSANTFVVRTSEKEGHIATG